MLLRVLNKVIGRSTTPNVKRDLVRIATCVAGLFPAEHSFQLSEKICIKEIVLDVIAEDGKRGEKEREACQLMNGLLDMKKVSLRKTLLSEQEITEEAKATQDLLTAIETQVVANYS